MKDNESQEMYLETILVLKNERASVRSVDVAERLGYAKSSVSRGINLLQDGGYIVVGGDGCIDFTPAGEQRAKRVYDRHIVLKALLVGIGADDALAERNACRIEHFIDDEMFDIIKTHIGGN